MWAACTVQTEILVYFFSESDQKRFAMVISKIQMSDPEPSLPSCFKQTVTNSIGNSDLKCIHFCHNWIYSTRTYKCFPSH